MALLLSSSITATVVSSNTCVASSVILAFVLATSSTATVASSTIACVASSPHSLSSTAAVASTLSKT